MEELKKLEQAKEQISKEMWDNFINFTKEIWLGLKELCLHWYNGMKFFLNWCVGCYKLLSYIQQTKVVNKQEKKMKKKLQKQNITVINEIEDKEEKQGVGIK